MHKTDADAMERGRGVADAAGMATTTMASTAMATAVAATMGAAHHVPLDQPSEQCLELQLEQARAQLELFARDLRVTLDEERRAAAALAAANARLQVLDRLKSDFLCFLAHELRTPLCALSLVTTLDHADDAVNAEINADADADADADVDADADANADADADADRREVAAIARAGYERLEQLIARAIEYFEWLALPPLHERSAAAGAVTLDLAELVATEARQRRDAALPVVLTLELELHACRVHGVATELRRVVAILLDNAVKFSGGDGLVQVAVQRARPASGGRALCIGSTGMGSEPCGPTAELVVRDRGCGFPPHLAAELLRPFTSADIGHHSRGSGLSLALADAIVRAHGGAVIAHSAGPGGGATFVVRLPLAEAS